MSFFQRRRIRRSLIQPATIAPPILFQAYPNFRLEEQEHDKWCWVSVSQGYINCVLNLDPPWSQSEVAAEILGKPDCLIYPERYNHEHEIYGVWNGWGHLGDFHGHAWTESGTRLFVDGHSIGLCQIEWKGGSHHYVLVVGWEDDGGKTVLHVCDPLDGGPPVMINYEELRDAYQRDVVGRWRYSGRLG